MSVRAKGRAVVVLWWQVSAACVTSVMTSTQYCLSLVPLCDQNGTQFLLGTVPFWFIISTVWTFNDNLENCWICTTAVPRTHGEAMLWKWQMALAPFAKEIAVNCNFWFLMIFLGNSIFFTLLYHDSYLTSELNQEPKNCPGKVIKVWYRGLNWVVFQKMSKLLKWCQ